MERRVYRGAETTSLSPFACWTACDARHRTVPSMTDASRRQRIRREFLLRYEARGLTTGQCCMSFGRPQGPGFDSLGRAAMFGPGRRVGCGNLGFRGVDLRFLPLGLSRVPVLADQAAKRFGAVEPDMTEVGGSRRWRLGR